MIYDVHKGVPTPRDVPTEGAIINIMQVFPDENTGEGWQRRARDLHERDADMIVEALTSTLPGGTLYRVMNKLFARHVENGGGFFRVIDDTMQRDRHPEKPTNETGVIYRRWCIEERNGVVWICQGNHDKAAPCDWRPARGDEINAWRAKQYAE